MLKHTRNTLVTVEYVFISKFTMNCIAPKLQKCWIPQNCLLNHIKPSTLPKEALANFYLSTTFSLSFMISSVAPIRSSTSYAFLIIKIVNRNLKKFLSVELLVKHNTQWPKDIPDNHWTNQENRNHFYFCDSSQATEQTISAYMLHWQFYYSRIY